MLRTCGSLLRPRPDRRIACGIADVDDNVRNRLAQLIVRRKMELPIRIHARPRTADSSSGRNVLPMRLSGAAAAPSAESVSVVPVLRFHAILEVLHHIAIDGFDSDGRSIAKQIWKFFLGRARSTGFGR